VVFRRRGVRDSETPTRAGATDLSAVGFDTTGWRLEDDRSDRRDWRNDFGDVISLTRTDPANFGSLSDHRSLVGEVRALAESQGGAILSVVSLFDHGWSSAQFIFKKKSGTGFLYHGWYLVPGGDDLLVFTVLCGERGVTGAREAIVAAMLAEAGQIDLLRHDEPESGRTGYIKDWFEDPYDLDYAGPVLRGVSDSEAYDGVLPDHPLTRLRKTLATLRRTLSLGI
jgi:hypothetical protein